MAAELPVLVGIDGSRGGLIALRWAASYATLHDAPLHAVYVLDDQQEVPISPPPSGADDGSEVLAGALEELEGIGFTSASLEVRHGHPAQMLLEMSTASRALVVGRRGLGGFAELVLGSTSQVCTALSTDVPLIVVPDSWDPGAPRQGRIVVGIDGSPDGHEALRFAFELAGATDVEMLGVHAVKLRENDRSAWADPDKQPWAEVAEQLLTQTLDSWKTKFPEVAVRRHAVADHPVRVLARESADADLVVVGGTGQTSFSELRMGSVARGLLHHSHCPVAVVHRD